MKTKKNDKKTSKIDEKLWKNMKNEEKQRKTNKNNEKQWKTKKIKTETQRKTLKNKAFSSVWMGIEISVRTDVVTM